jgi:hypothetical protein
MAVEYSRPVSVGWSCALLLIGALSTATARADETPDERQALARVAARIIAEAEPHQGLPWPPKVVAVDSNAVNAVSYQSWSDADSVPTSRVDIYTALLRSIVRDEAAEPLVDDRLAFVIGHEVAHLLLGHTQTPEKGKTLDIKYVFRRFQEEQADDLGLKLALRARYRKNSALDAIRRFIALRDTGSSAATETSFEGRGADHPSWEDRIAKLDSANSAYWRSMGAYRDGSFLLAAEQYASAERCFREVAREYPNSATCWANLGYAMLMRYLDDVAPEEIQKRRLGLVVSGGFYRQPKAVGGQLLGPPDLWDDAVKALSNAKAKGAGAPAQASLGLAYLISPVGVKVDLACTLFGQAAREVEADERLTPEDRAAVLINACAAELRREPPNIAVAQAYLDRAEAALPGSRPDGILAALLYNRAALRRGQDDRTELDLINRYFKYGDPASPWWPMAFARYQELCAKLNLPAEAKSSLTRPARLRMITSVTLGSGKTLTLDQLEDDAIRLIGAGQPERIPIVPGETLVRRLRFAARSIDLLSDGRVLSIELRGPAAPALALQSRGAPASRVELRVGMNWADLQNALNTEGPPETRTIADTEESYVYYRDIGLAALPKANQVGRLVLVRLPIASEWWLDGLGDEEGQNHGRDLESLADRTANSWLSTRRRPGARRSKGPDRRARPPLERRSGRPESRRFRGREGPGLPDAGNRARAFRSRRECRGLFGMAGRGRRPPRPI